MYKLLAPQHLDLPLQQTQGLPESWGFLCDAKEQSSLLDHDCVAIG